MKTKHPLYIMILMIFIIVACDGGSDPSGKEPTPTPTPEKGPATGPGDPTLTITPLAGPVGTEHVVTLENFDPNETVSIEIFRIDTNELLFSDTTIVNNTGSGQYLFTSQPDHTPGIYLLLATGEGGTPELFGNFRIDE